MTRARILALLACIISPLISACAPRLSAQVHHAFVSAGSGRVEYFWVDPATKGPWPAVVLIHGHQEGLSTAGGRQFVELGALDSLAAQGYLAVSVSQPGYGESSGPPDFMGPKTVAALEVVLRELRARKDVRGDRIALEGVSRGATVAALTAAQDTTIRAMVLISGVYDFSSLDPSRLAVTRGAMIAESGGSPEAMRERSALQFVERMRTSALIINGAKDDRTDPDQGRAFAAALQRHGVDARAIVYPQFGHAIAYPVRGREIRPFLARWLK